MLGTRCGDRIAAFAFTTMLSSSALAAVITVGKDGSQPTLLFGLLAAVNNGDNEVRVEQGTYTGATIVTQTSGNVSVSGGWNSDFSQRSPSALTTLSGGGTSRMLSLNITGGSITFLGFSFSGGHVGGSTDNGGAAMSIKASNAAMVTIVRSRFQLNQTQVTGAANAIGGALSADVAGDSRFFLEANEFAFNGAQSFSQSAQGGAASIQVSGTSAISVADCLFMNNSSGAATTGASLGGALFVQVNDRAFANVDSNRFLANSLSGAGQTMLASGAGAFLNANCASRNCGISVSHARFDGNHGADDAQLVLNSYGATSRARDVLAVNGDGGVRFLADQNDFAIAGVLDTANLTVTDNSGFAVDLLAMNGSTLTFFNSLYGPNLRSTSGVTRGSSLGVVDSLFINAAQGDYHLPPNSPFIDSADPAPPAGFDPTDLDGAPRINGVSADLGAYEYGDYIFANAFDR